MILYMIRHGKTKWNVEGRVQGHTDLPLCEEGIQEIELLREEIKNVHPDVVIASPLLRARQTAKLLFGYDIPINIDDRIRERDWGLNEGMFTSQVDRWDCWDVVLNTNVQNIEKLQDFMKRVSEFLEDIKIRYRGKKVFIVTHSAVMRVIHYLLGTIPEDGNLSRISIPNLRMIECEIKE